MIAFLLHLWRMVRPPSTTELLLDEPPPSGYRHAAIVTVTAEPARSAPPPQGPTLWRFTRICPLCGLGPIYGFSPILNSTVCGQTRRLRIGWFRRCGVTGVHLHQRCTKCEGEWLSSPPDDVHAGEPATQSATVCTRCLLDTRDKHLVHHYKLDATAASGIAIVKGSR